MFNVTFGRHFFFANLHRYFWIVILGKTAFMLLPLEVVSWPAGGLYEKTSTDIATYRLNHPKGQYSEKYIYKKNIRNIVFCFVCLVFIVIYVVLFVVVFTVVVINIILMIFFVSKPPQIIGN